MFPFAYVQKFTNVLFMFIVGRKSRASRDPSLVVAYICKVGIIDFSSNMVYVCTKENCLIFNYHTPLQLHPKKGNFLVAQAKELGLPV